MTTLASAGHEPVTWTESDEQKLDDALALRQRRREGKLTWSDLVINMIWAQDADQGIGNKGELLWQIPQDMSRFRILTYNDVVVMGRATWESIPEKFRPLKNRFNVVFSRDKQFIVNNPSVSVVDSMEQFLHYINSGVIPQRPIWVIGGQAMYEAFLEHATQVEMTLIFKTKEHDRVAPVLPDEEWKMVTQSPIYAHTQGSEETGYVFRTYIRRPFSIDSKMNEV